MIVRGLNKDKIAEAITRDLPFGIWCADFTLRTVTGYNKFCDLLETDRNVLRFDELVGFVREDYRSVVMLSVAELTSGQEVEITAPTNHRWIHLKMTHFDIEAQRAYGYITECEHTDQKPSQKEDTAAALSKETELISRAVDHLESKSSESAISYILEDLSRALNADRISMIEYNFMNKTQSFTNGTSAYGVASRKNLINDLLLDSTPWINTEMDKHKPLYIYDCNCLDQDKRAQLEILCCTEGQTVVFQPLTQHDQTFGYLIIDFLNKKREVSQAELEMLKSVSKVISFGSKVATTESRYMSEEDILHTMINVMPFGYLQMRYTYKSNGEPDSLVVVRVNNRLMKMINLKGINGMTIEQAFGQESEHIMTVCNKIAKDGQKTVVDDLMYINGKNISADVFMPNYNEFICLTSENSDAIYTINNLKNKNIGADRERINHNLLSEIQQSQRTHLNTILGFAELMAAEQDEKQKEKYMSIIKENAQSMLDSAVIKEAMQTEEETAEKAEATKAEDSNRRKKILIAEDTESNFMLIQYILKNDYDLEWARDGIEALEKYEQDKPDIILMDVRMPRMSGITATSRIREKDQTTPIIALTAFAFESDKQKTLEAGCTDFMSKPINTRALREMIKKYV